MKETTHRPVVFVAFANDRHETVGYLRNLPDEARRLREVLAPAERAGLCEVVVLQNCTAGDIFKVFQDPRYRNRVAIFHYGGHANGYQLLLESPEGKAATADAGGLAAFLAQQQGLRLVFLNGCSTQEQTQELHDANVSIVISTSRAIDDKVATDFADLFYRGLAGGATLRKAYSEASAAIKTTKGGDLRALYFGDVDKPEDHRNESGFPWNLYSREGAENADQWNLPEAVGDALFGLPQLLEQDLPESPYRHLSWFTKKDAEVFFGRGHQIRKLYGLLTAGTQPIILFYGQSGVGKSSLLDAGLLPRLEQSCEVRYLRRRAAGLLETLQMAFLPEASNATIETAWLAKEEQIKKPLIVFLDQVEEFYTQPIKDLPDELDQLLRVVKDTFGDPKCRPKGKLVLGFRKEWLAELEAKIVAYELPRAKVSLEPLDRNGIVEVVRGPVRSVRLRERYGLKVDDGLAEIIADDMLKDRGSAISTTLQILLSKMWTEAIAENSEFPQFSQKLYEALERDGILLGDFFAQQLEKFKSHLPRAADSGLLLDVLALHTTDLGSANDCSRDRLLEQYAHVSDELPSLLRECQNLYLLTETTGTQKGTTEATRLAHDTLAPLVRDRFDKSDKPGQRARRILDNRSVDWLGDNVGVLLDEADLRLVELGRDGTRDLDATEQRLVKASRSAREEAIWWRKVWISVGAAAIVAIVGLAIFGMLARSNAITQQKIAEGNQENMREALLGGFARTIGASDFELPPPDEQAALWELAELDSFNIVVRERLLDRWFQTKDSERRALKYDAQGLRAATGTNTALRKHAASRALELADHLVKEFDNPDNRGWVLLGVAERFSVVAASMDRTDAEKVAAYYADILVDVLATDDVRILQTDKSFQKGWGSVLALLATRMAYEDVARNSTSLVNSLEKLQDDDTYAQNYGSVLPSIGSALTGLATRLKSNDVRRIADRLADAMEDPANTSSARMSTMGNALAILAALMGSEDGASVAARGAIALAREMVDLQKTGEFRLFDLETALAALAVSIDSKDAANLAELFAEILENHQYASTKPDGSSNFASVVAALAARIDSKDATRLAERFAKVLENHELFDVGRVDSFGTALAALAVRTDGKNATSIADRLVKVFEKLFESKSDYGRNASLRKVLAALGAKLPPDEAATLAQRLAKLMDAPQLEPIRLSLVCDTLIPLANRMNAKDASDLSDWLVEWTETRQKTSNRPSWYELKGTMAVLAGRMDPSDAARLADRLVDAMENEDTNLYFHLEYLENVLGALAAKLDGQDAASAADRLSKVFANLQESDSQRILSMRIVLGALCPRIAPKDATRITESLCTAIEHLPESDSLRITSLGSVLAELVSQMDSPDAGNVAARSARVVIKNLEQPRTDPIVLSDTFDSSVSVLSALAPRLVPHEATSIGARVAKVLANELDPQQTYYLSESSLSRLAMLAVRLDATNAASIACRLAKDLDNRPKTARFILEDRGWALGAVAEGIPSARQTQLFALSHLFKGSDWKRKDNLESRNKIAKLCGLLASQDLADVLKWPVCVGETEELVVEALAKSLDLPKRNVAFGGGIWKFVEQAESLGIRGLDAPAKRPHLEYVLKELATMGKGTHKDQ